MYTGRRTAGWKRVVYSPGCGGCYLNRNRNSRSVLGIDYTIARAQAAHMNQIKDRPEDFLPQRGGGEKGGRGREREEEKRRGYRHWFLRRTKINLTYVYICVVHTYVGNAPREWHIVGWTIAKPQERIENRAKDTDCMPFLRFTKSGTTPRLRLSESRN